MRGEGCLPITEFLGETIEFLGDGNGGACFAPTTELRGDCRFAVLTLRGPPMLVVLILPEPAVLGGEGSLLTLDFTGGLAPATLFLGDGCGGGAFVCAGTFAAAPCLDDDGLLAAIAVLAACCTPAPLPSGVLNLEDDAALAPLTTCT